MLSKYDELKFEKEVKKIIFIKYKYYLYINRELYRFLIL